ncbi:zinc finger protein [Sesbania bispinosa]|nr:zinc finger protein [Sesbania bispinosa]
MSSASASSPPSDAGLAFKRSRDNSFSIDSQGEIVSATFNIVMNQPLSASSGNKGAN